MRAVRLPGLVGLGRTLPELGERVTQPDDILSAMFGQRGQASPEHEQAIRAYRDAVSANEIRERETAIANSWLLCTCRPGWVRVDLHTPPGHALCLIHGSYMITKDGRVL